MFPCVRIARNESTDAKGDVPALRHGRIREHAISPATETPRKRAFQDARFSRASCLRKRHWQHTSDQEVPLSQLYTPLAVGGPRQYGLPTVAGHVKTDLA